MILVDTNVFIYSFASDSAYLEWARKTILESVTSEGAVVNPVILAELCVGDADPSTVADRVRRWGVNTVDLPSALAPVCGKAFRLYIDRRQRAGAQASLRVPLPDFFIGAHAQIMDWKIATADTDRYRTYFPSVELVTPS